MAPIGPSSYLPPLDSCLDGDIQLLSWKDLFNTIVEPEVYLPDRSISRFLQDPDTLSALSRAFKPLPPPTSSSRSQLDQRTAAINIVPTKNGRYDLKELKDDSLWLSQTAGIDEVLALRLVILELQSRPKTRLIWGHEIEKARQPGTKALKDGNLPRDGQKTSIPERKRRASIVETFMQERQFIAQVAFVLVSAALGCDAFDKRQGRPQLPDKQASMLNICGNEIAKTWQLDAVSPKKPFIVGAVEYIDRLLPSLLNAVDWFKDGEVPQELEVLRCQTILTEAVHALQMVYSIVDHSPDIPRADVFASWFRYMNKTNFLSLELNTPFNSLVESHLVVLRFLAAIVSLAMISISKVITHLSSSDTVMELGQQKGDVVYYLQDLECIGKTTTCLLEAAERQTSTAALAALAWSTIFSLVGAYAHSSAEDRDARQSQKAIDRYNLGHQLEDTDATELSGPRPPSRRSSMSSESSQPQTYFEEARRAVANAQQGEEPVMALAKSALDQLNALNMIAELSTGLCVDVSTDQRGTFGQRVRLTLLALFRNAVGMVDYQDITLECCLALFNGGRNGDTRGGGSNTSSLDLVELFETDEVFNEQIWSPALIRFPYESLPFLKLCQAISHTTHSTTDLAGIALNSQHHLTTSSEADAFQKEIYDGPNAANIALGEHIDAAALWFPFLAHGPARIHQSLSSARHSQALNRFVLPPETQGQIISSGSPMVVVWTIEWSPYEYFRLVIKMAFDQRSNPRVGDVGGVFEIVTNIIGLLANLLFTEAEGAREFIFKSPDGSFDANADIASLVLELFESQLHRGAFIYSNPISSEFLANCVRFMHAVLIVDPGRIWPFLGRSVLLGVQGTESRLMSAVYALELPKGQFSLLTSGLQLFEALINDAASHASTRLAEPKEVKALTRFHPMGAGTRRPGATEDVIKDVLLAFTKIGVDVLERSSSWKYVRVEDRLAINTRICRLFDQVLNMYYGVNELGDEAELVACISRAARYIRDVFLARTASNLATKALLSLILEGLSTPVSTIFIRRWLLWQSQTQAALDLGIRIMRLSRYLRWGQSHFEQLLFDNVKSLTRLYASGLTYKLQVMELLNTLVQRTDEEEKQPHSLLNSMGQDDMRCFVNVLSHFDRPFVQPRLETAIWNFLSAAVGHKQQWFAIYLLNGKTPQEWVRKKGCDSETSGSGPPLFQIALAQLERIELLGLEEAIAMLEFIIAAIDYSPSAIEELESKGKLESALRLVANLKPIDGKNSSKSEDSSYLHFQAAALITRAVAMILHYVNEKYAKKEDRPAIFRGLSKSMDFLLLNGVKRPSYNASLHSNLQANFETKFRRLKLSSFKKTDLNPPALGKRFFYDIDAMKLFLRRHPGWTEKYEDHLIKEVELANLNLSLVNAQVDLFYAWKMMIGETNEEFREIALSHNYYIRIMTDCLEANQEGQLPDRFFQSLALSRVEIAIVLAQRFLRKSRRDEKMIGILKLAWNVTKSHTEDSGDIGSALVSDGADYARALLRLLYLLLGACSIVLSNREAWDKRRDEVDVTVVLEILDQVTSQGFRTLIGKLHDEPSKAVPADFALINAVLRSGLHFPGLDRHPTALYATFVDNGTVRLASTLLSWADQLTVHGDPIYGEIGIGYLLELSKVVLLAESLLVEGFFAELATARLFQHFQRPHGVGPFDEPARLHSIWTRGVLPLLANILGAVGAPAAVEVSTFLNLFQPQLARASGSFDLGAPSRPAKAGVDGITLAQCSEAQSLALLKTVLDRFREAGASAGIAAAEVAELPWDAAAVRLDLENLLLRRNALRDRLVPLGEREEAWARTKPSVADGGFESKYEEIVVRDMGITLSLLGSDDE